MNIAAVNYNNYEKSTKLKIYKVNVPTHFETNVAFFNKKPDTFCNKLLAP